MKIAITDLADYVDGKLRFEWLDVEGLDADDLEEAISTFLAKGSTEAEEHEEWFVSDYEDFPNMGEHPDLETIAELVAAIEEYPDAEEAIKAFYENSPAYFSAEKFAEAYNGEWDSMEDFAENLLEEDGSLDEIPERLRYYFDFEKFARDLEYGGDYWSADIGGGKIAVFRNL